MNTSRPPEAYRLVYGGWMHTKRPQHASIIAVTAALQNDTENVDLDVLARVAGMDTSTAARALLSLGWVQRADGAVLKDSTWDLRPDLAARITYTEDRRQRPAPSKVAKAATSDDDWLLVQPDTGLTLGDFVKGTEALGFEARIQIRIRKTN